MRVKEWLRENRRDIIVCAVELAVFVVVILFVPE